MKQFLHFQLKDKSLLIPIILGLILLSIVFALAFLAFDQSRIRTTEPPINTLPKRVSPTISVFDPYANSNVERIVPSTPLPLTPGLPYSFSIYFKNPMDENDVKFRLTYSPIYGGEPAKSVSIVATPLNQKTFEIKTTGPIKDYSEYILSVIDARTQRETFTKGYMTKDIIPTPIPSNSPVLIPFLPHETKTYTLEYFQPRNIYIFHFIYNSDLPGSAEAQFNDAQKEATRFIESKGINTNSIVIEWKHS